MSKARRRIRLIALDLDGTLLADHMHVSQRVRDAVRRVIDRGICVTLATGRVFAGTQFFAKELGIREPLICLQGALIRHAVTAEVLLERRVGMSLALEVIEYGRGHPWDFCVYVGDQGYVERLTPGLEYYAAYSPGGEALAAVGDLGKWLKEDPLKLLLVADETECSRADHMLRERFGGRLQIVRSYARFVEATHMQATKGQALAHLASHLGVERSDTMAIGDNDNDLDMVAWAGVGVAMGNASPSAKAAAKFIVSPVELDGAAEAIERWVLGASTDA